LYSLKRAERRPCPYAAADCSLGGSLCFTASVAAAELRAVRQLSLSLGMNEIIVFWKENWELILALVTAIGGLIGYFLTRRYELAWRRSEFICTQLELFDTDPDLVEIITILEGRHPNVTIKHIVDYHSALNVVERNRYLQKLDRFLNLLWRFCFAHLDLKTLSKREMVSIGWYLRLIAKSPILVDYCQNYGYSRIVTVMKKLGYVNRK
jgi:hypothetical protein